MCKKMAAVSCGTSHITTKQRCKCTAMEDIKRNHTHTRTHARTHTHTHTHSYTYWLECQEQKHLFVIKPMEFNRPRHFSLLLLGRMRCPRGPVWFPRRVVQYQTLGVGLSSFFFSSFVSHFVFVFFDFRTLSNFSVLLEVALQFYLIFKKMSRGLVFNTR